MSAVTKATKRASSVASRRELDANLMRMSEIKENIRQLEAEYNALKPDVFKAVEDNGGKYQNDAVSARIDRGETWQVDAIKLLDRFGAKIYPLIEVSVSKFGNAVKSDLIKVADLKGIAERVSLTPRLVVEKR